MSDGTISQDEIDALLSGVDMGGLSVGGSSSTASAGKIETADLVKFAVDLKDKLAHNVGTMTGADTVVNEPTVESANRETFLAKLPETVVAVMADFSAGLSGDHLYVLSTDFAQKLAGLINKEENADLDEMALSVIAEVVSGHTGAEITELTKNGAFPGLACNPGEAVNGPKAMVRFPQGEFVLFSYPVSLDGTTYTLWEAIAGGAADQISSALGKGAAPAAPVQSMPQQPAMNAMGAGMNMGGMQAAPMNMNGMVMQQTMGGGMNMGGMGNGFASMPMGTSAPNVQSLQFPGLQLGVGGMDQGSNIGLIMDVYMEMTVELGRTKKQIKEILGMGEGTIIELDKLAGEPVDILVNHKPIAKGEVVVIDENFGVRVTEILSPIERVTG
ncbi:MAG: flagellar motor switch protein FliN [Spirochaetaceae bacterium]|nr:flagellar motor switch protein FliN [Spirochaetaceae bacterium]